MKTIYRRLGQLEQRFGPTELSPREQRLLERIEAGQRRVAQFPTATKPAQVKRGSFDRSMSMVDILNQGRRWVAESSQAQAGS